MIAGFVVGGTGTTGYQNLLTRVSGPALAEFGVSEVLPDPLLQLNNSAGPFAANGDASGNGLVSAAAAGVGAFPWTAASGTNAALFSSLVPGAYTGEISGKSGDSGVALAEVYDATPPGTYTPASPRLINVSIRGTAGTGSNVVIAGFVVGGSTAKTVLIRASGPALAPFGVTGVLPDPQLQLFRANSDGSSTELQTNAGWGGDTVVAAVASSVGAFSWGATPTSDSAIVATLPPGAYTAEVSGVSGDSGITLVEVYDVP
jgi:hypothetical protein